MKHSICPVCEVAIEGDKVLFSYGEPGTRERLYARVCQYTKKSGCINTKEKLSKPISDSDVWKCPDNLEFDGQKALEMS